MNFPSYKATLIGSTCLALGLGFTMPAMSQESPQSAQSVVGLEEVTVTARRVEENLQSVPVLVTAFTGDQLKRMNVQTINDLMRSVGGLNICCQRGNAGFSFIRGLQGVVGYFAEVPKDAGGYGVGFDVGSYQVLKGPQGTLFGLANNAGAIVIEPKRPGETFGGFVETSVGSLGRLSASGAVDIPLADERVLIRLAGERFSRNGYQLNLTTGEHYGAEDYYVIRPSVTLKISDSIENYSMFQMANSEQNGYPETFLDFVWDNPALLPNVQNLIIPANGGLASYNALREQVMLFKRNNGPYKVIGNDRRCLTPDGRVLQGPTIVTTLDYPNVGCERNYIRDYFFTNHTTWQITDNISLKNIFGYRFGESQRGPLDQDNSPLKIRAEDARNLRVYQDPRTWSDELQLHATNLFDNRLNLTVGTFHYATRTIAAPRWTQFQVGNGAVGATIGTTSSRNRSVYGEGQLDISEWTIEGLTFTAGARYSWDTAKQVSYGLNANTLVPTGTVIGGPGSPNGYGSWSQLSWHFGLDWKMTPDTMFYFTSSKGYSSGQLTAVLQFPRVSPDSLTHLEAGVKSTFEVNDVTFRLNAAGYYGFFDNAKVNVFKVFTNASGVQTSGLILENAAKAHLRGIETEFTVIPTDWLEIGGFVTYQDNRYTSWPSLDSVTLQPISLTNSPFQYLPPWKFSLRSTVKLPLPAEYGGLALTGNFTWTDEFETYVAPRVPTDPNNRFTGFVCKTQRTVANGYPASIADGSYGYLGCNPSYENLDLALEWSDVLGKQGVDASFHVTNVTGNSTTESRGTSHQFGLSTAQVAIPRAYYLTLKYSF